MATLGNFEVSSSKKEIDTLRKFLPESDPGLVEPLATGCLHTYVYYIRNHYDRYFNAWLYEQRKWMFDPSAAQMQERDKYSSSPAILCMGSHAMLTRVGAILAKCQVDPNYKKFGYALTVKNKPKKIAGELFFDMETCVLAKNKGTGI